MNWPDIVYNKGDSVYTDAGNLAEDWVMIKLLFMNIVHMAHFCRYNSKFDLLVNLVGENVFRGVQVKFMGVQNEEKNSFTLPHINDYPDGTLMVGINMEHKIGIAYLCSDEYRMESHNAVLSLPGDAGNIFSKNLKPISELLLEIKRLLPMALILTPEIYRANISDRNWEEGQLKDKIFARCNMLGIKYQEVRNNSGSYDFVINDDIRIQLKSAQYREEKGKGNHFNIKMARNDGMAYKLGDFDYLCINISSHPNDFMFISVLLAVKLGILKMETCEGKTSIRVYPYDYNQGIGNTDKNANSRPKWSSDPLLWLTRNKGFLSNPGMDNIGAKFDQFQQIQNFLDPGKLMNRVVDTFYDTNVERRKRVIELLRQLAKNRGWKFEIRENGTSSPDILLNNQVIFLTFVSKQSHVNNHSYAYMAVINRSGTKIISKGMYAKFIFYIYDKPDDFLILDEKVLSDGGYLNDGVNKGKHTLSIYPYDYLEKNPRRKGNWTCNKQYWYNINNGCLAK
jgi:hypothetical protein